MAKRKVSPRTAAEAERIIREAVERGDVVFAPTVRAEFYDALATEVLPALFALRGFMLTDHSTIDDFYPRKPAGMQWDGVPSRARWSEWIASEIQSRYGVTITADATVVRLLQCIANQRQTK